jgi:hypothetical protein
MPTVHIQLIAPCAKGHFRKQFWDSYAKKPFQIWTNPTFAELDKCPSTLIDVSGFIGLQVSTSEVKNRHKQNSSAQNFQRDEQEVLQLSITGWWVVVRKHQVRHHQVTACTHNMPAVCSGFYQTSCGRH